MFEGFKVVFVEDDATVRRSLTQTLELTGIEVLACDSAEAAFGPVDVLVNSAGAAKRTPAPELTPEAFADAMQAKYFTTIHMLTPTIQRMAQRGQGTVVNVVGNGGKVASPIHLPGGAANAALMLVSAGLAAAYGAQGIRVNAVNPGATVTDRLKEGFAADARANGISEAEAIQTLQAIDQVWDHLFPAEQARIAHALIDRIVVRKEGISIEWKTAGVPKLLRASLTQPGFKEAA